MLALRAVLNRSSLYELREDEPVTIPFSDDTAELVITNGFHSSQKVELPFQPACTYFFRVEAVMSGAAIIALCAVSLLFFVLYAFQGSFLLLAAANLPVLALVWVFFLQPSRTIVLKAWQP